MKVSEKIKNGNYNNKFPLQPRDLYRQNGRALMIGFHNDLIVENGMFGHPKEPLVWKKAWSDGHFSGLTDVMQIYEELVEIAK